MRILLTGSNGFIGSNILRSLDKKYSFLAPTHSQLDLLDDRAVDVFFRRHQVDIVIHCAGAGVNHDAKGMFYDNARIFFNIVRCEKDYKRMIHIGSGAAYDKRYPIINIKEDDLGKRIPVDEYGLYKYICASYINQSKNHVDLRLFGIFGEEEEYRRRFISNALCRRMYGLPITIKQNVYFDYLDVIDFVKIVEYFIYHKPKFKAYNVGTGKKIDLVSIAHEIVKLYGDNDYPIIIKQKGLANEYSCNTKRLYTELSGFKPAPLTQSLERLYTWYQQNKKSIKIEEL